MITHLQNWMNLMNILKSFFQKWVKLHNKRGITNDIHMFGCGHILQYMSEWGNLNCFSQQGWEALNALTKFFYSQDK